MKERDYKAEMFFTKECYNFSSSEERKRIIYNLTLHELTSEQMEKFGSEIDPTPRGQIFGLDDPIGGRMRWISGIIELIKNAPTKKVSLIVGGDTAAFMLLKMYIDKANLEKSVSYLASLTDRRRDENGRFVFEHKEWLQF